MVELYTSYAPKQTGTGVSLVASSVASGEKKQNIFFWGLPSIQGKGFWILSQVSWVKGGLCLGLEVTQSSQGDMDGQTTMGTHTPTYGQFRVAN